MSDGQNYWCLTHNAVEPYHGCKSAERLGPYATSVEASKALEHLHERNEEWDNDSKWNDEDGDGDVDEDDKSSYWNPFR